MNDDQYSDHPDMLTDFGWLVAVVVIAILSLAAFAIWVIV